MTTHASSTGSSSWRYYDVFSPTGSLMVAAAAVGLGSWVWMIASAGDHLMPESSWTLLFVKQMWDFCKDQIQPWQIFMLPSVLLGVLFRSKRFTEEGFHDMFSISINLFVPSCCCGCDEGASSGGSSNCSCGSHTHTASKPNHKFQDNNNKYQLAVRTLKEVPIEEIFFDQAAVEVLQFSATQSFANHCAEIAAMQSNNHKSNSTTTTTTTTTTTAILPLTFVDLKGTPNAMRNVQRLRSHCASELSALFGVFQALAALRVGPVVCRQFCWAVTYEEINISSSSSSDDCTSKLSLKNVTRTLIAAARLSSRSLHDPSSNHDNDKGMDGNNQKSTNTQKSTTSNKQKEATTKTTRQSASTPAAAAVTTTTTTTTTTTIADNCHDPHTPLEQDHKKFRLILVELDCLRKAHLRTSLDLNYEVPGRYYQRRWETIRAMEELFNLKTGMPRLGATVLCGSVTLCAPLMGDITSNLMAPWVEWE